jgi:serine/threonine protein kinase
VTPDCGNIRDYEFFNKIGKGAYAIVKLAVHRPTGEKRAVKFYERSKLVDSMRKQSLLKEIKILKRIDHPNIIKLYEAIDTAKYVYLATEFVPGPSLLQYLKSRPDRMMTESEAKNLWTQLIKAVSYLHSKNITHRDIKLENILLSEDCKTIKLIDFGFSTC